MVPSRRTKEIRALIQFGSSIFVCSKPIQVLNCVSIVHHYGIKDARLYVYYRGIADHEGFREYFDTSSYSVLFKDVCWFKDLEQVVDVLNPREYETLFIEDDRVSFYFRFASRKTKRLVVFEEGLGTYRGQYQYTFSFLRKLKWKTIAKVFGCGFEFGSGRKTDYVMVQKPELFRFLNPVSAHKVLGFPGLMSVIGDSAEEWSSLIGQTLGIGIEAHHRVRLILGTWGGAPGFSKSSIESQYDFLIFKPHPHDGSGFVIGAIQLPKSWVPAEVYIDYLALRCSQLEVDHYSSSAALYLNNRYPNTHFRNLDTSSHLALTLDAYIACVDPDQPRI